jgi:hypothetical protein
MCTDRCCSSPPRGARPPRHHGRVRMRVLADRQRPALPRPPQACVPSSAGPPIFYSDTAAACIPGAGIPRVLIGVLE